MFDNHLGRTIVNEHFSALSLLLCLNWPGDIVITINISAMIIIFQCSLKITQVEIPKRYPINSRY